MNVIFHKDFYQVYTSDPASAQGRMEAVVEVISPHVNFVDATPALESDIQAVHSDAHINSVRSRGLYDIAALAAGGAVQTAFMALEEPCFGLIRPPGHHASADSSWGFCFFNNMAIAIVALQKRSRIKTAYVLDFDLHFGDGNVNILGSFQGITIYNPKSHDRVAYLDEVTRELESCEADIIGISAGFDNHEQDWGGVLKTKDYMDIGRLVRSAAVDAGGNCFGILEGGYNHQVLGQNVLALIQGLSGE
jgi:acetoin utilization deacetylase AcuC-like enzyme